MLEDDWMIFKKKNDSLNNFKVSSENSVQNLKQEMIKSLLRKKNLQPNNIMNQEILK